MADIIDIVAQLTYDVKDTELQKAVNLLQQQVTNVSTLTQRQQKLQDLFNRTSATEIDRRNKINALLQKNKALIDAANQSIQKQVAGNKQLQDAIVKEVGLINTLTLKLKDLEQQRAKAFDVRQINEFNKEIAKVQGQLSGLTTSKKSIFSGLGGTLLQGVGLGIGAGLITQGIGELKQFITESSRLAAEAEGVEAAFLRLNRPDLLDNLRTATKGTVSDLELMKNAINFNNFGLPIEKLGIALEFARRRAKDTGQEVDFLVQSIVTGIGRQSPLILDNLGINAKRVANEFQRTGNFAEAAFNIISEETKKAGADLDTFAEKQARVNANIANFQARIGRFFNSVIGEYALGAERAIAIIEALHNRFARLPGAAQKAVTNQPAAPVKEKVDFNRFTQGDLTGLSKPELEKLKESGQQQIDEGLVVSQGDVDKVNARITQINKALERFDIKVKKTKKEAKEKPIQTKELFAMTPEEWEADIDKRVDAINRLEKEIRDFRAKIAKDIESPEGIQSLSELISSESGFGESSLSDATRLQLDIQLAKEKRATDDAELQNQADRQKEIIESRRDAEIEAYNAVKDVAIQSFQQILQAKGQMLDLEIQAQRDRVNVAAELAERGNTEILESETKRLQALQTEREKNARAQIQINAVLQASNSAVAITEAIGAITKAAAQGDPYTIALRIAAAVAALIAGVASVRTAFTSGFAEGGYTGDGGKHDPAGIVHKGEYVMPKDKTAQYREVLEAMYKGTYSIETLRPDYKSNTTYATNIKVQGVEKRLDMVIGALEENKFKQNITFDERGIAVMTEKVKRKDRQRHK